MKRVLFGVTALFLAGTSAAAGWAAADHAAMLIPQSAGNYVPPPAEPAGLVTIFDNLGRKYPKGLYNAQYGQTLAGPQNAFEVPEFWQAAAFTPSADHTATRIQVALKILEGTNEVVVGLYDDNAGQPGNALQTWHARNVPADCCGLVTVKSTGVALSAGHQYWVVVKTDNHDPDFYGVWEYNIVNQVDSGITDYYCSGSAGACGSTNGVWQPSSDPIGLAFSVQGSE